MADSTTTIGKQYEQRALDLVRQQPFQLVTRNYRTRGGEIDLIIQSAKKKLLVFVEVRYRKTDLYGSAAESITAAKQHKIIQTCLHFIQAQPAFQHHDFRIDAITFDQKGKPNWIENAIEIM